VPPDERVGADQEAPPPVPGEHPGCRGQERSIGGGDPGSRPSSGEDLQLVPEHGRLEIPLVNAAPDEQTEQPAKEPIPEGPEHLSKSDGRSHSRRTARSEHRSCFFTPQGGSGGASGARRPRPRCGRLAGTVALAQPRAWWGHPPARVSDHEGQLGERVGEAGSWGHVGPEVVEAPAEVLDEGVPGNDDPGGSISLQSSHGSKSGF
jgi:hypothetical protein